MVGKRAGLGLQCPPWLWLLLDVWQWVAPPFLIAEIKKLRKAAAPPLQRALGMAFKMPGIRSR